MRSPDRFVLLLGKELRELAASRAYWLMLLVVGALVGHAFVTATDLYAEASGAGGGPAALAQGLSPLEGIVVPTFGVYELAAMLLFPFVVIRLVAIERETGALTLMLQAPGSFTRVILAKGLVLLLGWIVAFVPGLMTLALWRAAGGHLYRPEVLAVILGYLLRGMLTIGIGAAAGALASPASAAIATLAVTLGSWAIDFVAAARGGVIQALAPYTPSATLRVFERGEVRVASVVVQIVFTVAGLAVGAIWLRTGHSIRRRATRLSALAVCTLFGVVAASRIEASRDLSEDRRNSFARADERALSSIPSPLRVTVHLAAGDPRLTDFERDVLAKLRRTMSHVDVVYAVQGRTGLFEKPDSHYGEIWYELNGRQAATRSIAEPIVLETIFQLSGQNPPPAGEEAVYRGYPLASRPSGAKIICFLVWPLLVAAAWWWIRRPVVAVRRRTVSR